jgi:hypothetical protein
MHPQAPWWTHRKSKGENSGRRKNSGVFPGLQHVEGRKACWSSKMGIRKVDKQPNHSHGPTQTEQQIG